MNSSNASESNGTAQTGLEYHAGLLPIALADVTTALGLDTQYKGSWRQRGGIGAFFTICRKWDRIEAAAAKHRYNFVDMVVEDDRPEGVMDDIRDLRRYLLLLEAWLHHHKNTPVDTTRNLAAAEEGIKLLGGSVRFVPHGIAWRHYSLNGTRVTAKVGGDLDAWCQEQNLPEWDMFNTDAKVPQVALEQCDKHIVLNDAGHITQLHCERAMDNGHKTHKDGVWEWGYNEQGKPMLVNGAGSALNPQDYEPENAS